MNKLVIRSTNIENLVLTAYKIRSDLNSHLTFFLTILGNLIINLKLQTAHSLIVKHQI